MVPFFFLQYCPFLQNTQSCFYMDNPVDAWCISSQGFTLSVILLVNSEVVFTFAHSHYLHLTAQYLLGGQNLLVEALPRIAKSSVECQLCQWPFQLLTSWFDLPEIDLFATLPSHRLPLYWTWFSCTEAGGPDAFVVD